MKNSFMSPYDPCSRHLRTDIPISSVKKEMPQIVWESVKEQKGSAERKPATTL